MKIVKAYRWESAGAVSTYLHAGGSIGVLVDVEGEYDDALLRDLCMHIAATEPKSIDIASLDNSLILKEKDIYSGQLQSSGKPDDIVEKIIDGKIKKFYEDVCLLEQPFVIDNKKKVKDIISEFNKNNNLDFNIKNYLIFKLGL